MKSILNMAGHLRYLFSEEGNSNLIKELFDLKNINSIIEEACLMLSLFLAFARENECFFVKKEDLLQFSKPFSSIFSSDIEAFEKLYIFYQQKDLDKCKAITFRNTYDPSQNITIDMKHFSFMKRFDVKTRANAYTVLKTLQYFLDWLTDSHLLLNPNGVFLRAQDDSQALESKGIFIYKQEYYITNPYAPIEERLINIPPSTGFFPWIKKKVQTWITYPHDIIPISVAEIFLNEFLKPALFDLVPIIGIFPSYKEILDFFDIKDSSQDLLALYFAFCYSGYREELPEQAAFILKKHIYYFLEQHLSHLFAIGPFAIFNQAKQEKTSNNAIKITHPHNPKKIIIVTLAQFQWMQIFNPQYIERANIILSELKHLLLYITDKKNILDIFNVAEKIHEAFKNLAQKTIFLFDNPLPSVSTSTLLLEISAMPKSFLSLIGYKAREINHKAMESILSYIKSITNLLKVIFPVENPEFNKVRDFFQLQDISILLTQAYQKLYHIFIAAKHEDDNPLDWTWIKTSDIMQVMLDVFSFDSKKISDFGILYTVYKKYTLHQNGNIFITHPNNPSRKMQLAHGTWNYLVRFDSIALLRIQTVIENLQQCIKYIIHDQSVLDTHMIHLLIFLSLRDLAKHAICFSDMLFYFNHATILIKQGTKEQDIINLQQENRNLREEVAQVKNQDNELQHKINFLEHALIQERNIRHDFLNRINKLHNQQNLYPITEITEITTDKSEKPSLKKHSVFIKNTSGDSEEQKSNPIESNSNNANIPFIKKQELT